MLKMLPEEYRKKYFSHKSGEEFFRITRRDIKKFVPRHMSRAYYNSSNSGEDLLRTEIRLAEEAIREEYECVTDIDYCGPCIAATGWSRNLK